MIDEKFFYKVLLGIKFHEEKYKDFVQEYYNLLDCRNKLDIQNRNQLLSFHYYLKYAHFNVPREMLFCVTDNCQLRCKHCYFGSYKRLHTLSLEQIKYVNEKFISMRNYFIDKGFTFLKKEDVNPIYILLGGEPLLNKELSSIIKYLIPQSQLLKIDSNGLIFDKEIIDIMNVADTKTEYQISVDGDEYWHDFLRGKNTYKKTLDTIKKIGKYKKNIKLIISFNAHSNNYNSVETMIKDLLDCGVDYIKFNRYIHANDEIKVLSKEEYLEYKSKVFELKSIYEDKISFITKNIDFNYFCTAGLLHQSCCANGDRLACARYHIKTGNWFKDSIEKMVYKSLYNQMKVLQVPVECISCNKLNECIGGMRCITYAEKKIFNERDLHCCE